MSAYAPADVKPDSEENAKAVRKVSRQINETPMIRQGRHRRLAARRVRTYTRDRRRGKAAPTPEKSGPARAGWPGGLSVRRAGASLNIAPYPFSLLAF